MKYRQLGRTNLRVSLLGLGSGGENRLGHAQNLRQQEVHLLVRHALDLGINLIDTAPAYTGAEEALGEALQGVPRESYVLCTKFNARRGDPDAGGLRASLEASLRRLRTEYVDVLYFHGLSPTTYSDTVDRFMDEMRQAQADGLTRFLGMTELYEVDPSHEALLRALREDLFDVLMLGHNLISPAGLVEVLPNAQQRNAGVVVMCAVRSIISRPDRLRAHIREWKDAGVLAEDAVPDDAPLDWVLGPGFPTLTDAAYAFAAESPAVSSVLTGTTNREHLEANARSILGPPLPAAVSQRLRETFIPAKRSVLLHRISG
ncbi:MAG TPA: aldo/keto reductase [Chloroflexota bacterium]|nr:aldo/keto reductase [Chloroflexota bacterium]